MISLIQVELAIMAMPSFCCTLIQMPCSHRICLMFLERFRHWSPPIQLLKCSLAVASDRRHFNRLQYRLRTDCNTVGDSEYPAQ